MTWVAEGRQGALEVLYDRHAALVYSVAMRMLDDTEAARTLTRATFLRVWEQAGSFEPHKGSFARWLLALVRDLGLEARRAGAGATPTLPHPNGAGAARSGSGASAELDAWAAERRRRVCEALAILSSEQRRAVELAYFQGLTQQEIAETTAEPLGTVKSRLRLSLRKLREVLHPDDVEAEPA